MSEETRKIIPRGRGALENPKGRFERLASEFVLSEDKTQIKTQLFKDHSKTIISTNDSPDIGMEATLNAYRGCEHGCIYCYARPTHEYLGMSAGIDFETKLFVKNEAPLLLRRALSAKSWQPKGITMSGITDPYQPSERKLKITRGCLEVLAEFRNPVAIITKNHLVTRDIDILSELAKFQAVQVFVSITTLDSKLARTMEPRTSRPENRLQAILELRQAGIPAGVMMAPIIPGLTDHEIPSLLEAAASAGALTAGYTMLRLPYGVKDLFQTWLEEYYPLRKDKVIHRIQEIRGGKLNNSEWGTRMRGEGLFAEQIASLFKLTKKRLGFPGMPELSTSSFHPANGAQLSLFEQMNDMG